MKRFLTCSYRLPTLRRTCAFLSLLPSHFGCVHLVSLGIPLILPAVAVAPVAVVAFMTVMAVVAVSAVVVVMVVAVGAVVVVPVSPSLVAVAVVVVVVAALLGAGVHGGHVVDGHFGAVAEALVAQGARGAEVGLVQGLRAGEARVARFLKVSAAAAALPQVLPRPLVILVEPMAVGGGGVVGGGGAVVVASNILLWRVLSPA